MRASLRRPVRGYRTPGSLRGRSGKRPSYLDYQAALVSGTILGWTNVVVLCYGNATHEGGNTMAESTATVDGFRFLPPSLAAWIDNLIGNQEFTGSIPWTVLSRPVSEATVALVTSAGISLKKNPPFDMEREKREATWGDRSFRVIPKGSTESDIDANHLHINTSYILQDMNVIFPLARMRELEAEGVIGRFAPSAYSFYGFQWKSTEFLTQAIAPMSVKMREEGVDAVLLTPA